MKTFFAVSFLFVSTLFIVSCQREVTEELPPIITTSDSVVSKIIILDTTFPSGSDTARVLRFTYDANKRLSRVFNTYYNAGVSGPGRFYADEETIYQYSGTQTQPFRVDMHSFDYTASIDYNDSSFLTYTNGYISRDSTVGDGGDYSVVAMQRLSTTRYRFELRTPNGLGGQHIDSGYSYINWVGGNLVQEIDSTWQPGLGAWMVIPTNVTYDNKINPLKGISVPYPIVFQFAIPILIYPELALPSSNNILTVTGGSFPAPINYIYSYGPTGLPKIIRVGPEKGFYFYTHL